MVNHRMGLAYGIVGLFVLLTAFPGCGSSKKKRMHGGMGEIPEKYKNDGAPQVGDVAYLFKLKTLEGDKEVDLASFKGNRPVAIFFGSYT
ncbi:MAG: hypothetical protein IH987_04045 [Planctomycetes bacterium]|nr:hypothetical protein [Planctomycetota bacterium]